MTRAYLIGNWTDNDDCGEVTDLRSDGSFRAPNGGVGKWQLDGNQLTLSSTGNTGLTFTVQAESKDKIFVFMQNRDTGYSTRCRT